MGDVIFINMKFLEREWNEYNDTKDSVREKMMSKTGIYVSCCVERSWYLKITIAGMVHIL